METLSSVRIELGINAQRLISQFQINNKQLEESVQKGINLALDEMINDENFIRTIADHTKKEMMGIITSGIWQLGFREKMKASFESHVGKKIDEFNYQLSEKLSEALDKIKE
jgi:hypothetical protein